MSVCISDVTHTVRVRPTLRCQRRHVLVGSPVNLVSVRVNRQHQHHDASHDASCHWTHGGALDHVQRRYLLVWKADRE